MATWRAMATTLSHVYSPNHGVLASQLLLNLHGISYLRGKSKFDIVKKGRKPLLHLKKVSRKFLVQIALGPHKWLELSKAR